MRLVSYSTCEVAPPYLFRMLVLGLGYHRFERLEWVANNEEFARAMRSIVWDVASCTNSKPAFDERLFIREATPDCLRLAFSVDPEQRRKQKQSVLDRYNALAKEEQAMLRSNLEDRLGEALSKMPRLNDAGMIGWRYPLTEDGSLCARYARIQPCVLEARQLLTEHDSEGFERPDYEPRPLKASSYQYHRRSESQEYLVFLLLVRALGRSRRELPKAQ